MKIGMCEIGTGKTYMIADVGSNFNGSLDLAKEYIHAGKEIGIDAIKFQTYSAEGLLNPVRPDGDAWAAYEIVGRYELPLEWHQELFALSEKLGIEFLTTPFSLEVLDALNELGMRAFKIASGDLTFIPFLSRVGSFGKPVILSTGMAYMEEIDEAVSVLKHAGVNDLALLHCVSNYPPEYEAVNLRAIGTLRETFRVPVGLSDHTPDDVTALGAVALGASIIEKHIVMDRKIGTPDAPFAMTVPDFGEMVRRIRQLEDALGGGVKKPVAGELAERQWARRGIYAKTDIKAGETITMEKIKFVRPVNGFPASEWEQVRDRTLKRPLKKNQPIFPEDL